MQRPASAASRDRAGALGVDDAQGERGERRRGHQAEVPGRSRHQHRRPRERQAGDAGLDPGRRERDREPADTSQSAVSTVAMSRTRLNAATTPSQRNERQRQQVQERGVVVLREIDALRSARGSAGWTAGWRPTAVSCWNTHWFQTYTPVSPPGSPVKRVPRCSARGHVKAIATDHVTQRDAEAGAPFAPGHHSDRRLTFITIAVEVGRGICGRIVARADDGRGSAGVGLERNCRRNEKRRTTRG